MTYCKLRHRLYTSPLCKDAPFPPALELLTDDLGTASGATVKLLADLERHLLKQEPAVKAEAPSKADAKHHLLSCVVILVRGFGRGDALLCYVGTDQAVHHSALPDTHSNVSKNGMYHLTTAGSGVDLHADLTLVSQKVSCSSLNAPASLKFFSWNQPALRRWMRFAGPVGLPPLPSKSKPCLCGAMVRTFALYHLEGRTSPSKLEEVHHAD